MPNSAIVGEAIVGEAVPGWGLDESGVVVVKVVTETLGLKDSETTARALARIVTETLGLTEAVLKGEAKVQVVTETLGLKEGTQSYTVFVYLAKQEIEAFMSATLRQATPTTPDPTTQYVRAGAATTGLMGVAHGVAPGQDAQLKRAELVLTAAVAIPAGTTLTVAVITAPWNAQTVTYDTRPAVGASASQGISGGAGSTVRINVTSLLSPLIEQEESQGQTFEGFQLTADNDVTFYGAASVENRPDLETEVSRPPLPPVIIGPDFGLAVSVAKLYSRFTDLDLVDSLTGMHTQVSTSDDFTTPAWDSGEVATTTPIATPTGLVNNTLYYWRTRHRDSRNIWSGWSDVATFKITPRAALAVTQTSSPTPKVSWTLTGEVQTAYEVSFEAYRGAWVEEYATGLVSGTAASVTLPDAFVQQEGVSYRRTLTVYGDVNRADLPDDRAFYRDVLEYTLTPAVMA